MAFLAATNNGYQRNPSPGRPLAFPDWGVSHIGFHCLLPLGGRRYALRCSCSRSISAMVAINAELLGRQLVGVGEPK